jgi:hypothetical protein
MKKQDKDLKNKKIIKGSNVGICPFSRKNSGEPIVKMFDGL